jgi:hypothetical protein
VIVLDVTVVAADIARLVQNSPNQKLLGSSLAVLLKRGYPDFRPEDFGCRNLREFIRRYAKEIFEEGKKGTDVLYSAALLPAIGDASNRQQEFTKIASVPQFTRRQNIDTAVWKTFVSPGAPYRIYANSDTGELRVVPTHHTAPVGMWIIVPSCPPETHVEIAKEFVEGLADEAIKTQLTKILGLSTWWEHFFFSARNFGVERQWSAFRRRRLHSEFEKELKRLNIPLSAPPPVPSAVADKTESAIASEDDSRIRTIATAIIRRLPVSDLREVWLPLGYVLDEVGEK